MRPVPRSRFSISSAIRMETASGALANPRWMKLLASLRLLTGHNEEAVQILEGIVKDAPDLVEAHVQLATAYNRLKRPEDAQREKAIVDRLNAEAQAKQKDGGQ